MTDYKQLFEDHTKAVAEFLNELGPYLGLDDGKVKPEEWIKAASEIRQWCNDKASEVTRLTASADDWESRCLHAEDDLEKAEVAVERLTAEVSRLDAILVSAGHLYRQLHNIQEVRPRWANDSVCEAMRELGVLLSTDSGSQECQHRRQKLTPAGWDCQDCPHKNTDMLDPADSRQEPEYRECENCGGLGTVMENTDHPVETECLDCEGEGKVDSKGYAPSYTTAEKGQ